MNIRENIEAIEREALEAAGGIQTKADVDAIKVRYLGKKGELTAVLRNMKDVPNEEKPLVGKLVNDAKAKLEGVLSEKLEAMKAAEIRQRLESESIDITMPAKMPERGRLHPLTQTLRRVTEIFTQMGFTLVDGPHVETVFNNFDALNSPEDHPSRALTDTFYITENTLLRTHTSPVQIRTAMSQKPPIRIISTGRTFRNDSFDPTHSPMFTQVEGMLIDKNVTLTDLKGTLLQFAQEMFGKDTRIKFRPHYFPFTEPSAEMDLSCFKCGGEGCRICGGSGWIELLGCGMMHPKVLENCGIDPKVYSGFAFGIGVERIRMLKSAVDDIRVLYENDKRVLKQF